MEKEDLQMELNKLVCQLVDLNFPKAISRQKEQILPIFKFMWNRLSLFSHFYIILIWNSGKKEHMILLML